MSKPDSNWRVLTHGPLEQLADNLWWVSGSLPRMSLKRTMTVVRMRSGELVIHSAIALHEQAMEKLEALGTPAYMIIPNYGHKLDAPAYKARYPNLRVYTPRGGIDKVREVIEVDGTYEDFPQDDSVKLEMLHGVKHGEGAMIVRSPDGLTVVLNDAVMNMDRKRDLPGFLFTTLMGSAPGPRVSRLAKLMFVDDKKGLREDLQRYARFPDLVRLIVAHENVARGRDAAQALERASSFL
ncbi:MAG: hypothetical protein JWN48_6066 [Myxococcaceae bacterium]|nr:hypothetical protein [Myxococcaceae bacterium]